MMNDSVSRLSGDAVKIEIAKWCPTCKEHKCLECFTVDNGKEDGYYYQCRECRSKRRGTVEGKAATKRVNDKQLAKPGAREANNERCLKWHKDNPEKAKANSTRWAKANPEKVKARAAKWQKANPDKVNAYSAKWQKDNPGKCAAITAKCDAAKTGSTVFNAQLASIEQIYVDCPKGYSVRHIYPLRGKDSSGLHVIANLRIVKCKTNI